MSAVVSFLVIIAAVYLLAIITDEFFVVSLDSIAARLKMPSDVAGASLMAIGSSAPELSIALVAVILGGAHGDVGIGTIVGSAVFNILVITGASVLIAGQLVIESRSIERDSLFYLASIMLILLFFWDGRILIWETFTLLGTYIIYLVILWRWKDEDNIHQNNNKIGSVLQNDDPDGSFLVQFNHLLVRIIYIVARDPVKHYIWALLVSIAVIVALSYALVEATVVLATAIGIPPVIISLTLLAAGSSAPDLIASINVAMKGRGDMAVSNAIGSNIFDILVGLSVPWLVVIFAMSQRVEVTTDGLMSSIFILSGSVLLLYSFLFTKRHFSRWDGSILLIAYAAYIIYVIFTA